MIKYYFHHSIYILLLAGLSISSCNGQEKANTHKDSITSKPGPTVIRNFKAVAVAPDFDTTLVSQYIRSIFQDSKGNLWFGTLGEGVVRYDVKTLTYFSNPDGFNNNSVYAINEDRNGNLWFGTDQGVFKYNGNTFTNYKEKEGLSKLSVSRNSLFIDKDDNLWVGTEGGVFRYNPSADSVAGKCFVLFPLLDSIEIGGMLQDKAGNIWFASINNGIYRFDGKQITNISEKNVHSNSYGSMIQDKSGNLWFTVMNKGICRYDGKSFTNFTTGDGLGGNETWLIYGDSIGNIWISARGSITLYDGKSFKVFSADDGINCCVQSIYQDKSGNMWFGAGSGLFRFDGKRFYQVKQKGPW